MGKEKNIEKLVSVVIINRERKDFLNRCLASLKLQTYLKIEIIVVDNNSQDGSLELLESNYPEIKCIRNKKNEYYCKAANQGISEARGEYVLCLNNDIVLTPDYISETIKCFAIDDRIGMVSGKILKADKAKIDSTGLFLGRSRKPVDRGYQKEAGVIFWESGYTFGASGSASLFKKEMLAEIKINNEYFDEDFKIYYEDLDISWRANILGWKGYYTSLAIGMHYRGGTSKENGRRLFKSFDFPYLNLQCKKHLIKNRYLTMLKNDRLSDFLLNLPFILIYEIKLWFYLLLFEPKIVKDIINNIPQMKRFIKKSLKKKALFMKKKSELVLNN